MRICFLGVLIFLLSVSVGFSQGGRTVAVTAEKEVDIQGGDVAAARTVALAAAARDAVEKAYGTYVKVEELPNSRQILAKAASGLQYRILGDERKGNRYWVKIQAVVLIPEEYAQNRAVEREDLGEPMKNFVQKYPQGEINWGEGLILAFGKGEIPAGGTANADEMAARAAEVDAKAHMLEMINDIPLDDRMKAGEEKRLSFALEGFVQGAEVVARSRSGNMVNVTVQAPIRGVQGLTMAVYGYYTPEPPPPAVEPIKPKPVAQAEKFTGVVIDARAVATSAALFPKIETPKKQPVHTAQQVNKDDLMKRGMAAYAVVSRDVKITRLFPNAALVIPVRYMPGDAGSAPAGKTKRRQGYQPIVVNAVDSAGKLKATLIVSEEDAAKLKAIDQKTNALKECRVVIVVSSEAGGVEGAI